MRQFRHAAEGGAPQRKTEGHTEEMNEFNDIRGVYAALYTPFGKDGSVNEEAIEKLVAYGLANGLRGFYLTGSTGEGLLLSHDERVKVWKRVRACAPNAKLIAHVGAMATDDAVKLARAAADAGCDWVSSIWPIFYGRAFEAARRYYQLISEATDLPFMAYACGTDIVPDRDVRLFDLPNVKGLKYTGHSVWNVERLRHRLSKPVAIFSGADENAANALVLKDTFLGTIGTSQNTIPRHFVELAKALDAGDVARAARLQSEIDAFVDVMLGSPDGNASWHKSMIKWAGCDCGGARSPNGWELPAEQYAEVCRRLDAWKARSILA